MMRPVIVALAMLTVTAPPGAAQVRAADTDEDVAVAYQRAISRLRACASAGIAGAPRDSLQSAVSAIRGLCRPQLDNALKASDRKVARDQPDATREELAALRKAERRKLEYDLAVLVARSTGLQP